MSEKSQITSADQRFPSGKSFSEAPTCISIFPQRGGGGRGAGGGDAGGIRQQRLSRQSMTTLGRENRYFPSPRNSVLN